MNYIDRLFFVGAALSLAVACGESNDPVNGGTDAGADAGADAGTVAIAKAAPKSMPVGIEVRLIDQDSVVFAINTSQEPAVTWVSELRDEVLGTVVTPQGAGWIAELNGINSNERGLLLVEDKATNTELTVFAWVFQGPSSEGDSEIHSLDGALSLSLADGQSPDVRMSIFAPPVGGAVAGPYEIATIGDVTSAAAVFSPPGYSRGFLALASTLKVLSYRDGAWTDVPATVHADMGRVAFEAELPGAYVLVSEAP